MKLNAVLSVILLATFVVSSCLVEKPVYASSATENTWAAKAPLPEVVPGGKAAVVDGKIYVIGGSANYMYDPATDNWTARTPMPTPRNYFGIAVYQNKIYAIGGWNYNNGDPIYYSANEVYDPSIDTWQTKQPMPTNRTGLDANVVNGEIYLIGGRTGSQRTTVGLNEVYNVVNDSWTTKKPILYSIVGYASAVIDGKIYIMGGQDEYSPGSLDVNFTQIYDSVTDTWTLGAPMLTTVWNAAAGATTGVMAPKRIYLFGGTLSTDTGGNNITQVYEPQNNTWLYGASIPTARAFLTVTIVNDTLYAIGGSPGLTLPFVTSNEAYTPFGYGTISQPTSSPTKIESFSTLPIILASITLVALAGIGLLVYLKQKHETLNT